MRLNHNFYFWLVYFSVILVLTALYVIGPLQYSLVFSIVGFSSVIAVLVGTRINMRSKQVRIPWYFFALGLLIFTIGDVLAYNYVDIFDVDELPFPSAADVLYLGVYPAFIVGMSLTVYGNGEQQWKFVDVLIALISIGTLMWATLMVPIAESNDLSVLARLIAMLYPLGDLLLFALLLWLVLQSKKYSLAFCMLVASLLVLFATDIVYSYLQVNGIYEGTGNWLDGGWMLFYGLFGAAALHPSVVHSIKHGQTLDARRLALFLAIMLIVPLAFVGEADTVNIAGSELLVNITLGISCFVLGAFVGVLTWRLKKHGHLHIERYDFMLGFLFITLIFAYISIQVSAISNIEGVYFWREAALSIGTVMIFLWLIRLVNDLIKRDGEKELIA